MVGEDGRYQLFAIITLSSVSFFLGFIVFCLPYIFFEPSFFCKTENGELYECTEKMACDNQWGFETKSGKFFEFCLYDPISIQ